MKTKSVFLILIFGLTILLNGCTTNNGDIGDMFGQWRLTEVMHNDDGSADGTYSGNMFWSFQNTTVEIKQIESNNVYVQTYGNFYVEDETLTLTFPDDKFPAPSILGTGKEYKLQIISLDKSHMTLGFDSRSSSEEGYGASTILKFKKW